MATAYDFPSTRPAKAPAISVITIIGIVFVGVMAWQIGTTIAGGPEPAGARVVEEGDTVTYQYAARGPDGTLFRTNIESVAQDANADTGFPLQQGLIHQPERVRVGSGGSTFGEPLETGLLGARVGETVTVTLPAGTGTGEWTSITSGRPGIDRVIGTQPYADARFFQEPEAAQAEGGTGTMGFSFDALKQQIPELESGYTYEGETLFPPSLPIVFEDVNADNRSVLVRYPAQHNRYYDIPALPGGLTLLVEDGTLAWRFDGLQTGETFIVTEGDHLALAGLDPGSYMIGNVDDRYVELLHNPYFAPELVGGPLIVEVTVLDIAKAGSPGAAQSPITSQDAARAPTGTNPQRGDGHTDHTH